MWIIYRKDLLWDNIEVHRWCYKSEFLGNSDNRTSFFRKHLCNCGKWWLGGPQGMAPSGREQVKKTCRAWHSASLGMGSLLSWSLRAEVNSLLLLSPFVEVTSLWPCTQHTGSDQIQSCSLSCREQIPGTESSDWGKLQVRRLITQFNDTPEQRTFFEAFSCLWQYESQANFWIIFVALPNLNSLKPLDSWRLGAIWTSRLRCALSAS